MTPAGLGVGARDRSKRGGVGEAGRSAARAHQMGATEREDRVSPENTSAPSIINAVHFTGRHISVPAFVIIPLSVSTKSRALRMRDGM